MSSECARDKVSISSLSGTRKELNSWIECNRKLTVSQLEVIARAEAKLSEDRHPEQQRTTMGGELVPERPCGYSGRVPNVALEVRLGRMSLEEGSQWEAYLWYHDWKGSYSRWKKEQDETEALLMGARSCSV
jgi:hypothetical protein